MNEEDCKHEWKFQGMVYAVGRQLSGSGAHEMVYYDRYYCSKCLDVTDKNKRVVGSTYEKPLPNAMPA